MGLLSKASLISTEKGLAFSNFIISHQINIFAVFQLKDSYYSIVNSIGFDGTSLLSSLSTKDFWDGLCEKENTVYNFDCKNKSLNPLLQFFSFELMDEIKNVSLYKSEDYIYMLCNREFKSDIINDLSSIDFTENNINLDEINKKITKETQLLKYSVYFKEAVANFLSIKAKDSPNIEEIKLSIYNELINRFSCELAKYATLKISEDKINVLISLDKSILPEHLICHIVYNLRAVLGHTAEMISFTNLGIADNFADVKAFLQVE